MHQISDLTNLTDVQDLLDRLDLRLDEPCTVPDCSHGQDGWLGMHDVVAGVRAA